MIFEQCEISYCWHWKLIYIVFFRSSNKLLNFANKLLHCTSKFWNNKTFIFPYDITLQFQPFCNFIKPFSIVNIIAQVKHVTTITYSHSTLKFKRRLILNRFLEARKKSLELALHKAKRFTGSFIGNASSDAKGAPIRWRSTLKLLLSYGGFIAPIIKASDIVIHLTPFSESCVYMTLRYCNEIWSLQYDSSASIGRF